MRFYQKVLTHACVLCMSISHKFEFVLARKQSSRNETFKQRLDRTAHMHMHEAETKPWKDQAMRLFIYIALMKTQQSLSCHARTCTAAAAAADSINIVHVAELQGLSCFTRSFAHQLERWLTRSRYGCAALAAINQ